MVTLHTALFLLALNSEGIPMFPNAYLLWDECTQHWCEQTISPWTFPLHGVDFSTYCSGFFCPNGYHGLTLSEHGKPSLSASAGSRKQGTLTIFFVLHMTNYFVLFFYKCSMMVAKTSHRPCGQYIKWLTGKHNVSNQSLDRSLHCSNGRLPSCKVLMVMGPCCLRPHIQSSQFLNIINGQSSGMDLF